jgi:sterol 3beta-glucosyltransferase
MKPTIFLIPTIGTRGDLQPYIALASQLRKAGHDPIVASHPCMEQLVKSNNVKFARIGPDIDIGIEAAKIRANAPHWLIGFMRVMKFSFKMLEQSHNDIVRLARDSQVMIVSHTAAGSIEADQLKMKSISVSLFPQAIPIEDPTEPLFKRMVGSAAGWGMGLMMKKPLDRIRQRLGVEPMGEAGITSRWLNLIPISPYVIPSDPRWETRHKMTGYWFVETPDNWSPPEELVTFLKAGDPPVVINLGAMALGDDDDEDLIDLVLTGLENVGVRAVLQGWNTHLVQKKLPTNVIHIGAIPHTWLLHQACAFIHHGGFGSTAAAFQAGIPALVIPHIIDQFIWGQKVHELRVGVAPIPRKKISEENFTKALAQLVSDSRLQENAAALGEQIRAEKGLETAVGLIEDICYTDR